MTNTIYGVALNDARQRDALAADLLAAPYNGAPNAPVLFIKPLTCVTPDFGTVAMPESVGEVVAATTIALRFSGRPNVPVEAALAIELSEPHTSFYRPAIRQHCRDGFLPLGRFDGIPDRLADAAITLEVDGVAVHSWPLDRLMRGVAELVRDITAFMTLSDNDILLVGLPGDAPRVEAGTLLTASATGFSPLSVRLATETVR